MLWRAGSSCFALGNVASLASSFQLTLAKMLQKTAFCWVLCIQEAKTEFLLL